jgi:hypothetical protein
MLSKDKVITICILLAFSLSIILIPHTTAAGEMVSVLTNRYDNNRSSANLHETTLNISNVNVNQFGKLFSRSVEGDIYAQPLYYPNLSIPGKGTHNVVFIATADNNVYAFDADDPEQSEPLWQVNFGAYFTQNLELQDIWDGHDGVLSTPVIDSDSGTMYVVSHHPNGKNYGKHILHALDILTGSEKRSLGSPVTIQATFPSLGCDNYEGIIALDSYRHLQRPGLLLLDNVIYMAFGSTGNRWPFHGWILAYDAKNVTHQIARFSSSAGYACRIILPDTGIKMCQENMEFTPPNAQMGFSASFWQSGTGLSTDGTSIFGVTGNGAFSAYMGGYDYGDSVLRLSPKLRVQDYFTPYIQYCLDKLDQDLGVTGALLVPGTNLVIASGKDRNVYLIDKREMGKFNTKGHVNLNVQTISVGNGKPDTTPIFWNSPAGPVLYTWNEDDVAKQWGFTAFKDGLATLKLTPLSVSKFSGAGAPGGILALSANDNTPDTGILWGTQQTDGEHTGILRAWDASDLSKELWNSNMAPNGRDSYGKLAKFNQPTIANGKVYQATFSNKLNVYGLLPEPTPESTEAATSSP